MHPASWRHYAIEFTDPAAAEQIAATDLLPALITAQEAGIVHRWWYVRKNHTWRVRCLSTDPGSTILSGVLNKLQANDRIAGWAPGIYEPETFVFGGEAAMEVAHDLFHHDSRHLLTRVDPSTTPSLGQCETAVMLCSALLRGAGLDWYEQGDVWAKVAGLRPASPSALVPARIDALAYAMRVLMTTDPRALSGPDAPAPLASYLTWVAAFEYAGEALASLAANGQLERGMRAVLAHHIIFHANRAGLPIADQSALATLACHNVFHAPLPTASTPSPTPSATRVNQVTTLSEDRPSPPTRQLRATLTDELRASGVVRTAGVDAAIRHIPRHLFLPEVPLEEAYADAPVYTKKDADGTAVSAASQPQIVAMMLEQLAGQPGENILEIGAGTGYNAALIAAITGTGGHVTTIEVDRDLADGARNHLHCAGVINVSVVCGDGALGHPPAAPYDRIIATAGAWDIPAAWLQQLTRSGRLVVPLRLRGTTSRSIIFERDATGWRSRGSELAVFMPLRGVADDARHTVALTPGNDVSLQVHKDQAVSAADLAGVLETDPHHAWTGVLFPPMVPYEWMDLWLACQLPNALMRMSAQGSAVERGQVTPMFGWGSMATTSGSTLAYLTTRPAPPAEDGGKLYEVGVITHGPTRRDLALRVAHEIHTWDTHYRHRSVRFEMPAAPVAPDPSTGRFVLDRPHHPITVIWE